MCTNSERLVEKNDLQKNSGMPIVDGKIQSVSEVLHTDPGWVRFEGVIDRKYICDSMMSSYIYVWYDGDAIRVYTSENDARKWSDFLYEMEQTLDRDRKTIEEWDKDKEPSRWVRDAQRRISLYDDGEEGAGVRVVVLGEIRHSEIQYEQKYSGDDEPDLVEHKNAKGMTNIVVAPLIIEDRVFYPMFPELDAPEDDDEDVESDGPAVPSTT